MLGFLGAYAHIFLVLCECIWYASAILLVLPTFDDTGSWGSLPHEVVYPPDSMVRPWVTASHFLVGNKEAELKPTTFLCFLVLPLILTPSVM